MGRRDDDIVDDARAEAVLRHTLARLGEPSELAPPPDLVTRTARRLPAARPAIAARNAARAAALRLAIGAGVGSVLLLIALVGVWSALGGGPQLALLFGDGAGGLSRALLMLQLFAKPLLHSLGALGAPALLGGFAAIVGAGWLWWLLLRRTPVQYAEPAS